MIGTITNLNSMRETTIIEFEDYEQLRSKWFQSIRNLKDCKVIVLDKKQKKKKI